MCSRASGSLLVLTLGLLLLASACGIRPPAWGQLSIPAGQPIVLGVAVDADSADTGLDPTTRVPDALSVGQAVSVYGHAVQILPLPVHCSAEDVSDAIPNEEALGGLAGVIAPPCSRSCIYGEGLLYELRTILIAPGCTASAVVQQGFPNVFRMAWNDADEATLAAQYARQQLRVKRVVVVHDTSAYGRALTGQFTSAFSAREGRIVQVQIPISGTINYASLVKSITAADAGAIFLAADREDTAALFRRLDADLPGTPVIGTSTLIGPEGCLVPSANGGVAPGTPCQASDGRAPRLVAAGLARQDDAWASELEHDPTAPLFANQDLDAIQVFVTALRAAARPEADGALTVPRKALRDAIAHTNTSGLTGAIRFNAAGERRSDVGAALYELDGPRARLVSELKR